MDQNYPIFISYRRELGENFVIGLQMSLENETGLKVFLDRKNLPGGDFMKALDETIAGCTDVVVVIPPHGLDRCRTDPNDVFKHEIALALQLNKNVIPVTMPGFEFPKPGDAPLPEEIAAITGLNAAAVSHDYYDAFIAKIISQLHSKPVKGMFSREKLEEFAKLGNMQAVNELGLIYEFGHGEADIDLEKARLYYQQAAEQGDPGGLYDLGDVYEQCAGDLSLVYDYGIEDEISGLKESEARQRMQEKAVSCYSRSADSGFLPAIYRLGNLAEDQDIQKAAALYQKAAEGGYSPAMNALGFYLNNGIAGTTDQKKAEELFKKAADVYAPAAYNYARILEMRNPIAAERIYSRIAFGENAIPRAAHSLGMLYEKTLNRIPEAVKAYRTAMEGGILEAEEDLHRCQSLLLKTAV